MSLELLGAASPPTVQEEPRPSAWWKWILGLGAAAGLGYWAVKDLPMADMMPRQVPAGRRPW